MQIQMLKMLKTLNTFKMLNIFKTFNTPYHIVRYRAEKMHEQFLEKESMATQAQILRCLLVSKKLRESWLLLGIQNKKKDPKVKQNVFENIVNAIKTIGNSRKKDTSVDTNNAYFI